MENETKQQRSARIFRTIMNSKGYYDPIQIHKFLDLPYYQVYYLYNSKTSKLPDAIVRALFDKFPDLNPDFICNGEGDPFLKANNGIIYSDQPVTSGDLNMMLDRMTLLFEKVHALYERTREKEEYLTSLSTKLESQIEKLEKLSENA